MALIRDNNFYSWTKGDNAPLSPNFFTKEFDCHCHYDSCQEQRISVELVEKLQSVRDSLGTTIHISSGLRCSLYQQHLREEGLETSVGVSQHELGRAADLGCYAKHQELKGLLPKHFKAIGEARTWFHVDLRDDRSRYWTYKG